MWMRCASWWSGGYDESDCVYDMRMARVNVYLPDDLAEEAKAAGLNLSKLTQEALKGALSEESTTKWLAAVAALGSSRVSHEEVLRAVGEAKDDFEG